MTEVFVIRNQLGHYWGKGKEWVDGREPKLLLRLKHHDEAINTLFELSAKDVDLRGEILAVEIDDKGLPLVQPSAHPVADPGLPEEKGAAQAGSNAART